MTITTFGRVRRTPMATTAVVLVLCGATLTGCGSAGQTGADTSSLASSTGHLSTVAASRSSRIALYTGMRTLWAQHMEWTYATVVAFAGSSPALDPTIARLLRNQADIGKAFGTYFGRTAGHRLTHLLRTHIQDAVPVLTAAKAGDATALDQAIAAWQRNARDIADFLAASNPHWKRADMRSMMHTHITQTVAYAAAVLGGDFTSAIEKYDVAEAHMAQMADMLSAGIVQQFPHRFAAGPAARTAYALG